MKFVLLFVNRASGHVDHVLEQDMPFKSSSPLQAAPFNDYEVVELGLVDAASWTDLEGSPCSASQHLFQRLGRGRVTGAEVRNWPIGDGSLIEKANVRRIHDVPCTLEGLQARVRRHGPAGIPSVARAWLATVLPPHTASTLGVDIGLPISVLKAAEGIRNRRDPEGGSRMAVLNRMAELQAQNTRKAIERRARAKRDREQAAAAAAAAELAALQAEVRGEREALEREVRDELASLHDTEGNVIDG